MSERRIESRYLCAALVTVDWVSINEATNEQELRTEEALLEDISEIGGCVQLEGPVPLGSNIMLSIQDQRFVGRVCYCVYRDYGYFVGIRFSEETVWNQEKVVPNHLTNLHELAHEFNS